MLVRDEWNPPLWYRTSDTVTRSWAALFPFLCMYKEYGNSASHGEGDGKRGDRILNYTTAERRRSYFEMYPIEKHSTSIILAQRQIYNQFKSMQM